LPGGMFTLPKAKVMEISKIVLVDIGMMLVFLGNTVSKSRWGELGMTFKVFYKVRGILKT